MMEEGIVARLLTDSGVAALVSDRVYPVSVPQASPMPAIAYVRISGQPVYTSDGESGLASARLEIDCWGETYTSAKQVARAVIESLSAWFGTSASIVFQFVLLDTERDFREGGSNNSEYLFRTNLDLIVWYET